MGSAHTFAHVRTGVHKALLTLVQPPYELPLDPRDAGRQLAQAILATATAETWSDGDLAYAEGYVLTVADLVSETISNADVGLLNKL